MIRAVLDANVLVSAAIRAGGKPDQVLRLAPRRFVWLTSEFIINEVAGVLSRPHIQTKVGARVSAAERARFLATVRAIAATVEVKATVTAVQEDEKDNPVLACGVDGQITW
jgi:putative PIN family toxin of toxin-antitoxin system